MAKHAYRIHLEPEPEGGYTVTVPSLPGCVTWGEDYDHAMAMAKEAIGLYLEVLVEDGMPIPHDQISAPVDTVIHIEPPAVA
ncbi:MAG: type II toxin-antitoxin system HicB family antitoxin [Candidatus Hydrogenedentes bacterium]|nr:type II toxin-antitoxin system HicB family antitoxin [Candidatus Hydrogenedentota bacterium]